MLADGHADVWMPVVSPSGRRPDDRHRRPGRIDIRRSKIGCARSGRWSAASMLDAMPDGEPSAVAVRADARIPVSARQGATARALPVGRAGLRRRLGECWVSRSRSNCCTTLSWCTTTSPTAAKCAGAGRPWRPTTVAAALNAGDGLAVVAGQVLRRATRRLDRDLADLVLGRVRHHGDADARGSGHRVGWQRDRSRTSGPRTT